MFDSTAPIEIAGRAGNQKASIVLRWPSDQEWDQRTRSRKVFIKRLGRGVSETTIDSVEADAKLYAQIKEPASPDLSPAEANRIIEAIGTCEVLDCELNGAEAAVTLQTMTGETKHQLRIPSADEVLFFRRGAVRMLEHPYGKSEIRQNLDSGAKLYDACHLSAEGYANGIPSLHKDFAIRAVIEAVDRELRPQGDENF